MVGEEKGVTCKTAILYTVRTGSRKYGRGVESRNQAPVVLKYCDAANRRRKITLYALGFPTQVHIKLLNRLTRRSQHYRTPARHTKYPPHPICSSQTASAPLLHRIKNGIDLLHRRCTGHQSRVEACWRTLVSPVHGRQQGEIAPAMAEVRREWRCCGLQHARLQVRLTCQLYLAKESHLFVELEMCQLESGDAHSNVSYKARDEQDGSCFK